MTTECILTGHLRKQEALHSAGAMNGKWIVFIYLFF